MMGSSASTDKPSYTDKIIFSKQITSKLHDNIVQTRNYNITFVTDSSKTFIYLYKNKEHSLDDNQYDITDLTAYGTWTEDKTGKFTLTGQQIVQHTSSTSSNDTNSDPVNKSNTEPFTLIINNIYDWQQTK